MIVPVTIYTRFPACKSEDCPHKRDCANHDTAGDYRTEDGMRPDLRQVGDHWECSQAFEAENFGAVLLDDPTLIKQRFQLSVIVSTPQGDGAEFLQAALSSNTFKIEELEEL